MVSKLVGGPCKCLTDIHQNSPYICMYMYMYIYIAITRILIEPTNMWPLEWTVEEDDGEQECFCSAQKTKRLNGVAKQKLLHPSNIVTYSRMLGIVFLNFHQNAIGFIIIPQWILAIKSSALLLPFIGESCSQDSISPSTPKKLFDSNSSDDCVQRLTNLMYFLTYFITNYSLFCSFSPALLCSWVCVNVFSK